MILTKRNKKYLINIDLINIDIINIDSSNQFFRYKIGKHIHINELIFSL